MAGGGEDSRRRREAGLRPWHVPKSPLDDAESLHRSARILSSPAYRRADRDPEFLDRDDLRGLRLQLEYLKAETVLREQGIRSTVVVFGSTRIVERSAALRWLRQLRDEQRRCPKDRSLARAVRVAERIVAKSRYYDMARELARIVSAECRRNGCQEYVVVTGGGPGIMEAANRGACETNAKTIGLNIVLPHEQIPNPYVTPELCLQFRYFALRKMHFLQRARALVIFPGGYGTLDELFDALCLIQTGKMEPVPVVLVGRRFWRRVLDVDYLVEEGMIDPADRDLFCYAENPREVWERIRSFWADREEAQDGAKA